MGRSLQNIRIAIEVSPPKCGAQVMQESIVDDVMGLQEFLEQRIGNFLQIEDSVCVHKNRNFLIFFHGFQHFLKDD